MFERYKTPSVEDSMFRRAWINAITGVFRQPADADYIDSRIMWRYGRKRAFSWSASQAIEKYIKAFLLLNGFKAKFNHNYTTAIPTLKELFGPRFESEIAIPRVFEVNSAGLWADTVDFWSSIKQFAENGSTAGRYGESRLTVEPYAIHVLDRICFSFRKISIDLMSKSENVQDFQKELLRQLETELDPKVILGSARHTHQGPEMQYLFSLWNFELSSTPPTSEKYHFFSMQNTGTVHAKLLEGGDFNRLKELFERSSNLKLK